MTTTQKIAIAAACLVTIGFRLNLPWLPNLGTMVALSLLCGCACKSGWGFAIPLGVRVLTDFALEMKTGYGFFSSWPFDYSAYLLIALLGSRMNAKSALQIGGGTLVSVGAYFLISNFGTWYVSGPSSYENSFAGLQLCLAKGLPFVKNSLYGNLIAAPVFFAGWAMATSANSSSLSSPTVNAAKKTADNAS